MITFDKIYGAFALLSGSLMIVFGTLCATVNISIYLDSEYSDSKLPYLPTLFVGAVVFGVLFVICAVLWALRRNCVLSRKATSVCLAVALVALCGGFAGAALYCSSSASEQFFQTNDSTKAATVPADVQKCIPFFQKLNDKQSAYFFTQTTRCCAGTYVASEMSCEQESYNIAVRTDYFHTDHKLAMLKYSDEHAFLFRDKNYDYGPTFGKYQTQEGIKSGITYMLIPLESEYRIVIQNQSEYFVSVVSNYAAAGITEDEFVQQALRAYKAMQTH